MPDGGTGRTAGGRIAGQLTCPRPVVRPGTPGLLRELNDRAALELLLPGDPLTRAQLAEATGVSKVTVTQMLTRLEARGLVHAVGEAAGGRGPNAVFVIGSPGIIDPSTGDRRFAVRLPAWHEGVLAELRGTLRRPPVIENDVNLAAVAERAYGAAVGVDDFVLVWIGVGVGMAISIGGRLYRGTTGAAGEIGYLPLPGAPVSPDIRDPHMGGFQWLAAAEAVRALARVHEFEGEAAEDSVRAAMEALTAAQKPAAHSRAGEFVRQLAHRVALGVTSVCTVLDPGLVVLGGELGFVGGAELAGQVSAEVTRMCPANPRIVPTEVPSEPVVRGALLAAVD
jgi:predicted NBD/HSP70 family sugar kinase